MYRGKDINIFWIQKLSSKRGLFKTVGIEKIGFEFIDSINIGELRDQKIPKI